MACKMGLAILAAEDLVAVQVDVVREPHCWASIPVGSTRTESGVLDSRNRFAPASGFVIAGSHLMGRVGVDNVSGFDEELS